MDAVGWAVAVAAMVATLVPTFAWRSARRALAASHAEAEQLRALVKKRVERPNVFSHEVRTPLALIKGAAELLADESPGPLNPRQREFVTTIATNAEQVIALAEDLLAEARIDAQLFELRTERLDVRALVRGTVRDARRIHPNPIRLENQGPPLHLMGDRALLGQVLWNLVNNACRHSDAAVPVTVSVTQGDAEVIVAVTDEGEGMSDDERARLFEPFSTGSQRPGTGLGMMITERIVTQHGGRLLVDTTPGRGTTVFFVLPIGPPDDREAGP